MDNKNDEEGNIYKPPPEKQYVWYIALSSLHYYGEISLFTFYEQDVNIQFSFLLIHSQLGCGP